MNVKELTSVALVASMALAAAAAPARAADAGAVVDRAAIDQALASRAQSEKSSREAIKSLLERDDVRAMAGEMGLDIRRAEGAVASLQGDELQQAARQATAASDLLVGGSGTIQLSLVSLLLIIIIVILLAN